MFGGLVLLALAVAYWVVELPPWWINVSEWLPVVFLVAGIWALLDALNDRLNRKD